MYYLALVKQREDFVLLKDSPCLPCVEQKTGLDIITGTAITEEEALGAFKPIKVWWKRRQKWKRNKWKPNFYRVPCQCKENEGPCPD